MQRFGAMASLEGYVRLVYIVGTLSESLSFWIVGLPPSYKLSLSELTISILYCLKCSLPARSENENSKHSNKQLTRRKDMGSVA